MISDTNSSYFCYVSFQDIQSIPILNNQTILAVKAPRATKLQVPESDGKKYQIFFEK